MYRDYMGTRNCLANLLLTQKLAQVCGDGNVIIFIQKHSVEPQFNVIAFL